MCIRDSHYSALNGVWGMRMKTMSQPDYGTVTCLTQAGKVTASSMPGNITEVTVGEDYFTDESRINEAPFMYKYNGTYYLTYASNGYTHISYSVHQAVGSSPLGPFRKLGNAEGNPVLDGSLFGTVNGTAHHSFVQVGDELWVLYHRHDSNNSWGSGWGRSIGSDRVCMTENADGLMVLTANGPSKCLEWLPEEISGYQNLAESATVKISAGDGVEYLNDGLLPYYTVSEEKLMSVEGTDVTITLKWEEPVRVSSLMVYNAREMGAAFSGIADIRFALAERPAWASKDYDYAVIKDLAFPELYYDLESEDFINCAPAVAEFDPILVSEIAITIKATDRLVEYNRFGEENTLLNLCEIVVLGGVDDNE